ncbi:MAG: CvpA family protein [Chloroflexi bacterium]|nr:CvpA family protein [Chloroflexota bacterium]
MTQFDVNWVDAGISFLLLAGLLAGAYQGLLRQALLLGSIYISTVLAAQYYRFVNDQLWYVFPNSDSVARSFASLALVFIVAFVVLNWMSYTVHGNTRLPVLSIADLTGGAALGLFSGWILAVVVVAIVNYGLKVDWIGMESTVWFARDQMSRSIFAPVLSSEIQRFAVALRLWLPAGLPAPFA